MLKLLLATTSFSFILTADCQTIDFTFESGNGLYCNPTSILFKQACTGNPVSFIWSFGNGTYSDKPVDSSFYTTPGSYTVKLVAIYPSTSLAITKVIVISPTITASIGVDKNYLCKPGAVNFTAPANANIKSYEWNFGDGTAAVNTSSDTISHSFANFGTDTVILKVTSVSGCTDSASTIITIKNPVITENISPSRGCIPAVVNFDVGVTIPTNSSVTSYTWDFGDGSAPFISTINKATHTYSSVGDFFPAMKITSSDGCTYAYKFYNTLHFGTPPPAHVAYPVTNPICASDSAVFITKATNANRYYWEFGDGSVASSKDTIIKHKYNTIGNKTVRVKAYYNECDAPTITFPFTIKGVVANYALFNSCSNKNTYSFSDSIIGIPTSTLWNFGDGYQLANTINPVHSFPVPGQFKTTLTLVDNVSACSDSISRMVYTAIPELYIADYSICRNNLVSFSILNNYTDTSARYTWHIPGPPTGPVANDTITVAADSLGSFNYFVVIGRGRENCPDTVTLNSPLLVKGPNLNFTAPPDICLNTPLVVINNSKPFIAADSIQSWYWNFGNSTTNDPVFQPAPYEYTTAGTYNVKLTAIDKNGCVDSLDRTVIVKPAPFLHIIASADSVCKGESVTLIAVHNNDLLWSPATNVSCTTCDTTIVTPLVSTTYYGTATNSFNCSVKDSNLIRVNNPFTTTIVPADIYICKNETTTVDVNPKGKKIIWAPAAGLSDANIYNPLITGKENTTYTVTLTDSTGCLNASSAALNVHIKPPPSVDAGPDKFYSKGTSYSLAPTYGNNVNSYLWTPSDLLSCNTCAMPNGTAMYNQQYIIKVTADNGCTASDSIVIGVDCKAAYILMPKAFTPNDDNLNDVFYPRTIGIKSIIKFTIYNRQGQVIYEAHNFSPNDKGYGWNGKFKGVSQPMNTYVYTIETICEIGERLFKKDTFLLLR